MSSQARQPRSNDRQEDGPKNSPPVWSRKIWTGTGNVECAVFEKTVGDGDNTFTAYNVVLRRTYKQNEEYKSSQSLRSDDVPIAIQLLTQAYAFISHELNDR